METCLVKGVALSYLTSENEKKPNQKNVVFLHGAGASKERWKDLIDLFEKEDGLFALALDLPGHGNSQGSPCDQVFLYREWVKEFVDANGMDSFYLVGHSMGAAIALDFASKYLDRLEGLVLVGGAPSFKVSEERLEEFRSGEYKWEWARVGFAESTSDQVVEIFYQENKKEDAWARYLDYLACSRYKAENLEQLKIPSLVICGEEDKNTPPKLSKKLAQEIENAKLVFIKDAAHQVMIERPEILKKELEDFIGVR